MNFINQILGGNGMGNQGGGYYQQQSNQKAKFENLMQCLSDLQSGQNLDNSNSIILPSEVLNEISQYSNFHTPMLFCITNMYNHKNAYVGVRDFTAPRDHVVVPQWLYQKLELFEGIQIGVSLVPFYKKGKLIKIQPHETAFIDLPNPKAILEHDLPLQYQFLTKDQTIVINHMKKQYKLNILLVQPDDETHTICVIDTDLNIDFAPPLDYIEPEDIKPLPNLTKKTSSQREREEIESQVFKPFSGNCVRIDEKKIDKKKVEEEQKQKQQQNEYDPRKFKLKHGIRHNLDQTHFTGQGLSIGQTTTYKK